MTIDPINRFKIEEATNKNSNSSKSCILAAIDIGTNSIHMVVVQIDPLLPAFTIIAREKDTVRLGDRDPETGNLTPEAMQRALAALRRCQDLAQSLGVNRTVAVATSATREAPNGREFLEQIEFELGLVVDLISGVEEARRIYLGVLSGMEFDERPHVIVDIGGGSTELILADSKEARFLSSTKIGAVRLTKELISTDPISEREFGNLKAHVRGMLERPVDQVRLALQLGEVPRMVGTSGTIETLATINAIEKLGAIPNPLNGYQMSRQDVLKMVERFASMDYDRRFAIPGISDKRAEIILAGATILAEVMTMLDIDSITICERALREGIIVDWMLSQGFIESRLHYQSEVRQRSVMKIANKYQVDLDYSKKIVTFALDIFDQIQGILHYWGDREKQLLWAATILHNCGVYVSHAAHHKHSYYLIRNAELLGFTEVELEVIANIARYHRKSKPKKKHQNYRNLPNKKYRNLVNELSAILRIAVALDRRQIGAIQELKCEYDSPRRKLYLRLIPTDPEDDCSLELWNLNYKKVVFEEEYGVKIVPLLEPRKVSQISTT